jgi:hypothetical protein
MVPFLVKYDESDQPKQQDGAGNVAMRGLQQTRCCDGICNTWGDAVVVAEILMVQKYYDAIFWGPIESGMFCTDARCNMSVLQLNW